MLTVSAAWPGATAQEMQDLVAEPLEKRMQELRWYDRVETMTRPGLAFMTVTLKDSTPPDDVPEEFYQARKKLGDEARNLPSGVLVPSSTTSTPTSLSRSMPKGSGDAAAPAGPAGRNDPAANCCTCPA